ncbi:MAG: hypothetical protein ABSF80_09715 [Chitinispirillaceae bacterium]
MLDDCRNHPITAVSNSTGWDTRFYGIINKKGKYGIPVFDFRKNDGQKDGAGKRDRLVNVSIEGYGTTLEIGILCHDVTDIVGILEKKAG